MIRKNTILLAVPAAILAVMAVLAVTFTAATSAAQETSSLTTVGSSPETDLSAISDLQTYVQTVDLVTYLDAVSQQQLADYLSAVQEAEAQAQAERQAAQPAYQQHQSTTHTTSYTGGGSPPNSFLACVRNRESGGNYSVVNSSSGASGAYQFLNSSWAALGFAARYGVSSAAQATPAQQDQAAAETYARMGRSPWAGPGC